VAKFPEPPSPADLQSTEPEWWDLPASTLLVRIYNRGGTHPTEWNAFRFYGPLDARFVHHEPPPAHQERGILYGATLAVTCIAEKFQATRTIDPYTGDPWLVVFRLQRQVRLLDLTRAWPTRAGTSMVINSGQRPRARRWSRAIYEAYQEAEGLWYASSMHANAPAVALYERARSALPPRPEVNRSLADATLDISLENAALELGYAVIPRLVSPRHRTAAE
jgi:RES domain